MTNKQLYDAPLAIYAERFAKLDPRDAAARCGVPFYATEDGGAFAVIFCGAEYRVEFPSLEVTGPEFTQPADGKTRILLARYLVEGRLSEPNGKFSAYRDFPWGGLYDANFQGRCVKRLAFTFGNKLREWSEIMLKLGAAPLPDAKYDGEGAAAFDWRFMPKLTVRFLLWAGEPEENIAPAAQMLFSDNFADAFSSEDMAVIGDLTIDKMKNS